MIDIFCLNVRSLQQKVPLLQQTALAEGGAQQCAMVAVVETALHTGEQVTAMPGYDWYDGRRAVLPGVRSSNGVGVWVRNDLAAEVLSTSDRVVWLRLPGGRLRPTFIAFIYAPVEVAERRAEAVAFWRSLGDGAAQYSDRGDVVVMGDCNGRVIASPTTTVSCCFPFAPHTTLLC